MGKAVGIIEVYGLVAAFVACDAGCKAADVTVENFGRVYGYSDTCAAFLNKGLIVEIAGENLTLSGISLTVARVTGSIHSITYTLTDSK